MRRRLYRVVFTSGIGSEWSRVEAARASPTSVSVLMTRRAGTPSSPPDYVVTASSTGSFSPAPNSGQLLASVPFKGMRYAIHDRSRPAAYMTFDREHAPFNQLLGSPGAEARSFEQALAERFERGREQPVDVVYRDTTTRGRLRAEAIFDRTTQP
jgi:hypothetical protein